MEAAPTADVLARVDARGLDVSTIELPDIGDIVAGPTEAVRAILLDVRARGDAALIELTSRFDGVELDSFVVDGASASAALESLPRETRAALEAASVEIEAFHRGQLRPTQITERGGVRITSRHVPVERVGVYVPGGRAAYPSTVLMTAIPARVAGAGAVVLCTPPGPDGRIPAVTLAAAAVAGVDEIYAVGGAQAIAALAYGTATIPPVDVIAGPGNRFVATAKREVAGIVGIPSAFAGPSEVVVIADSSVPAAYVAADLLVQAEHGPDGLAWLIAWDEAVVDAVRREVECQVTAATRAGDIVSTLRTRGRAVLVDGPAAAIALADRLAPEHLELLCTDAEILGATVRNAGAVFCGPWSCAAFGDYVAGPSHVLPTARTARFGQALTVADFLKDVHVVTVDRAGFERLGGHVEVLARAEGFDAHAAAIQVRRAP